MNIFSYAVKNLKIYKYRTIILIITLVLVVTASVVGLSIQSATRSINKEYRDQIGAKVYVELDFEKLISGSGKSSKLERPQMLTSDQYKQISELDYVKSFTYTGEVMGTSSNMKAIGEGEEKSENSLGVAIDGGDGTPVMAKSPTLKILGVEGNADLEDFRNGLRKVVEGTVPKNDNEALISQDIANHNNLKIGDSIAVTDITGKKEINYIISGIYEDKTVEDGGTGLNMPIFNRRNEVFTTFTGAMQLDTLGNFQVKAEYELNDPKDYEAFQKSVRDIGVGDDYKVSIDQKSFDKAVGPINNLEKTISFFMNIIFSIAAGVLMLLSILAIKERQYDVGVLRAMGMKKIKVGMTFMIESLVVLVIAIAIGAGIGSVITQPIATSLLNQQVVELNKQNEEQASQGMIFSNDRSLNVEPIGEIQASVNVPVMLNILILGFVIIMFTNAINIVYIMRFQPMEIMRKKN